MGRWSAIEEFMGEFIGVEGRGSRPHYQKGKKVDGSVRLLQVHCTRHPTAFFLFRTPSNVGFT